MQYKVIFEGPDRQMPLMMKGSRLPQPGEIFTLRLFDDEHSPTRYNVIESATKMLQNADGEFEEAFHVIVRKEEPSVI